MVVASLALGGAVGVVLSGAFLWWEVGRFAAPQVPVTVFDERKVLAAYTVGLFVGVPLAASFVLMLVSFGNGALPGAGLFLLALVAGAELAQVFLVRSKYWGGVPAVPFYAVSFRAGVGAVLALTIVASYLGGTGAPTVVGVSTALVGALALLALEVSVGLLAVPSRASTVSRVGGPLPAALFSAVGFFLLGIGPTAGVLGGLAASLVVLAGATLTYRGRRPILAAVPPPTGGPRPPGDSPLPYGRTALPSNDDGPGGSARR